MCITSDSHVKHHLPIGWSTAMPRPTKCLRPRPPPHAPRCGGRLALQHVTGARCWPVTRPSHLQHICVTCASPPDWWVNNNDLPSKVASPIPYMPSGAEAGPRAGANCEAWLCAGHSHCSHSCITCVSHVHHLPTGGSLTMPRANGWHRRPPPHMLWRRGGAERLCAMATDTGPLTRSSHLHHMCVATFVGLNDCLISRRHHQVQPPTDYSES